MLLPYLVNKQRLITKDGRTAKIAGAGNCLKGKTDEVYHNSASRVAVGEINLQPNCSGQLRWS
jgi:hypothetical protein